jgi:SnoaL-like domain
VDLDSLRINQLTSDGWTWYREYLTVLDGYDLDAYLDFLSPAVSVQFNNDEPMVGRDVVKAGLSQFWGSVTGMGYTLLHEPLNIYGDDQHLVLEALNHYDSEDRTRVTVRATAWTDRDDDGKVTWCGCTRTSRRCTRRRRADRPPRSSSHRHRTFARLGLTR